MSYYFFDSSALLKRYSAEQGTSWVLTITTPHAGNSISIAQITPVEVISGIERRRRAQQLSARSAQAVRLLVDRHVGGEYKMVALTDSVITHAKDLVILYSLRAYDVVQLASALEENAGLLLPGGPLSSSFPPIHAC